MDDVEIRLAIGVDVGDGVGGIEVKIEKVEFVVVQKLLDIERGIKMFDKQEAVIRLDGVGTHFHAIEGDVDDGVGRENGEIQIAHLEVRIEKTFGHAGGKACAHRGIKKIVGADYKSHY